jgi:hypothetical protein
MTAVNIKLFELGKSNRDLYNICQLVLKTKDIKTITPVVVSAGGACLVELFAFNPTFALKYTTQLKAALALNPNTNTRQTSFQFNTSKSRYDPYEYIPRFYESALDSYITVCSPRYQDMNKKYGLPDNETHRTEITSAADLLTTIAKLCNILLPLCNRKKVDCFHIQYALKIIYLSAKTELEQLLIKTINSTAKLLVNDGTLANTIKTDPMISKTVATVNAILTGGITITNEAAIYLSMFMLGLNPDIPEPDKLITLSTKKTVSKKKKSPTATPIAAQEADAKTTTSSPSTTNSSTIESNEIQPADNTTSSEPSPSQNSTTEINETTTQKPITHQEPVKKLAFKLKF